MSASVPKPVAFPAMQVTRRNRDGSWHHNFPGQVEFRGSPYSRDEFRIYFLDETGNVVAQVTCRIDDTLRAFMEWQEALRK